MKCSNCGVEILPDAAFCPECGVPIQREGQATEPAQASYSPEPAVDEPQPELRERPKAEPKRKNTGRIIGFSVGAVLLVAVCILCFLFIVKPAINYNEAVDCMEGGMYAEAYEIFVELEGHKDSNDRACECYYNMAVETMESDPDGARSMFESLDGYSNSEEQINECDYRIALSLMEEDPAAALPMFEALKGYSDSEEMAKECNYRIAAGNMESGGYEEASAIFEELGDYRDSREMYSECRYNIALALLDGGSYEEASAIFEGLGDYEDSVSQYKECNYNIGLALMEAGDYRAAYDIFKEIGRYSNAGSKLRKCAFELGMECYDAYEYDDARDYFAEADSDEAEHMIDMMKFEEQAADHYAQLVEIAEASGLTCELIEARYYTESSVDGDTYDVLMLYFESEGEQFYSVLFDGIWMGICEPSDLVDFSSMDENQDYYMSALLITACWDYITTVHLDISRVMELA